MQLKDQKKDPIIETIGPKALGEHQLEKEFGVRTPTVDQSAVKVTFHDLGLVLPSKSNQLWVDA